jgi:hypothetical protein
VAEHEAKRVYVYEVKLCQEDGTRGSGWSITVVTASQDPADLLRIARVRLESGGSPLGSGPQEKWTGLDEAKLVTVAVLDPRIAV